MAFALMLVADLTPASERVDPILKSLFLPIHTTLAFFGYAALFVAFAMGVLYLFQERELKSRSPRRFYYLIPSLERCDTIGGRSVIAGFGFLTLAIITGVLWNRSARGLLLDLGRQGVERPCGLGHLRPADHGPPAGGLGRAPSGPPRHRRLQRGGLHVRLDVARAGGVDCGPLSSSGASPAPVEPRP